MKIKVGTINAHLLRLSVNAPSRTHYRPKPGDDDVFFQIDPGRFRLYDPLNDPAPITKQTSAAPIAAAADDVTDAGGVSTTEFAYEHDLRDYLAGTFTSSSRG